MSDFIFFLEHHIRYYSWWGFPASFLGGVLAAFSPCILPILPVTISLIGEAAIDTKIKPFLLSLVFVAGVTLVYSVIGVLAAAYGFFLEALINTAFFYLFSSLVFIVLGVSFLGFLRFRAFDVTYKSGKNLTSLFILGAVSGLIMIPCVFPVLATILFLVSLGQNIPYAAGCLFFFALGYGVILILIGSSTGLIKRLSAKRQWFIIVHKILGFLLLVVGAYLLWYFLRIY
jgi:thiol:disulfide interchange protein DsbD